MKNLFAPYDMALTLKNLGFDEPCFGVYANGKFHNLFVCGNENYEEDPKFNTNSVVTKKIDIAYGFYDEESCTAPTFQQIIHWLRYQHTLFGSVNTSGEYIKGVSKYKVSFQYTIAGFGIKGASTAFKKKVSKIFDTFEAAELECIKSMIEIVQKKK